MKKRAAVKGQKQAENPVGTSVAMQQLMLPLLLAMDATKKGLLSFAQQMWMVVLSELLAAEAAQIARPEGQARRRAHAPPLGHGHDAGLLRRASCVAAASSRSRSRQRPGRRSGAAEHRGPE